MPSFNLNPGPSVLTPSGTKTALAWAIFFTILAPSAVALRFYAKRIKRRPPWWDDWVLVAALICYLGNLAGIFATIFIGGLGHHETQVTHTGLVVTDKEDIIIRWVYILEMCLIRGSICLFLWQLFPIRQVRVGVLIATGINLSWLIFGFFYVAFLCQPFAYNWDTTIEGGYCLDRNDWYAGVFAWEIVIDGLIWSLPIPSVWSLRIPRVQKIFITAIFALGLLDIAVAIVRITVVLNLNFRDLTFDGVDGVVWSLAEPAIGIIVACAPLYKSIVDKIVPTTWRDAIREKLSGGRSGEDGGPYAYTNTPADHLGLVPHTHGTEMMAYVDDGTRSRLDQEGIIPSSPIEPHDNIVVKRDLGITMMT